MSKQETAPRSSSVYSSPSGVRIDVPMVETLEHKISSKTQQRIEFDSEAALKIIAKERKAMRIRKWIVGTAAVLLPLLIMSAGVYNRRSCTAHMLMNAQ